MTTLSLTHLIRLPAWLVVTMRCFAQALLTRLIRAMRPMIVALIWPHGPINHSPILILAPRRVLLGELIRLRPYQSDPNGPACVSRIEQMQSPIASYEQAGAVRDWNPQPRTSARSAHTRTNVSMSDEDHGGVLLVPMSEQLVRREAGVYTGNDG